MPAVATLLASVTSVLVGVTVFTESTVNLGTQPACSSVGCWTNYTVMADLSGDGELDIIFPNANGFFGQGPSEPLVILINDGSGVFTDTSAAAVGNHSGWVRQVALADIEGDGDLDLFVPDGWGGSARLFVNNGSGVFADEAASRLDITTDAGSARFADVDNDGDSDLLIGQWVAGNAVRLFLNDGAGVFIEASSQVPPLGQAGGTDLIDMDLFDADGDFDLDLLLNTHGNQPIFWTNDGAGNYVNSPGAFPNQNGTGFTYNSSACDVDGDGDLDVWHDNALNPNTEQLTINNGAGQFTDETFARVTGNSAAADDNGVLCADFDNDGVLDAAVASLTNEERILYNDGTGNFTASIDAFPSVGDATLWVDFGDVDGDGRMDAVTAQGEAGSFENRLYLGNASLPADTTPPQFRAVETLPDVAINVAPVFHFAVVDQVVTDLGPRLTSVTAVVNGTPINAFFMGGDVYRVELPAQTGDAIVTYQACATDRAGNSACSPEASYAVTATGATPTPTATPGPGGDKPGGGCACSVAAGNAGRSLFTIGLVLFAALAISRFRRSAKDSAERVPEAGGGDRKPSGPASDRHPHHLRASKRSDAALRVWHQGGDPDGGR